MDKDRLIFKSLSQHVMFYYYSQIKSLSGALFQLHWACNYTECLHKWLINKFKCKNVIEKTPPVICMQVHKWTNPAPSILCILWMTDSLQCKGPQRLFTAWWENRRKCSRESVIQSVYQRPPELNEWHSLLPASACKTQHICLNYSTAELLHFCYLPPAPP